ncbi:multicopper oxidase-domain-containing protein [Neurospora tetraspora]|uniref:laccase n=1 Tax=Neurospora tetraspora TaxID=94610 RepID=A0AAE0JIL4_9PEZI|nr:multicopper oxidase-domain-containing protein [Neurospora tetraspora]
MKSALGCVLSALVASVCASSLRSLRHSPLHALRQTPPQLDYNLLPRAACDNTNKSRHCWGNYSIDTNYYDEGPDTGVTREYWLSIEEGPCEPDGYARQCQTVNGTVPGPTIIADWGDSLIIHVTNNLQSNGTAIHWHGLRQSGSNIYDGVPGITQCAIAIGQSMTYQFKVSQYGSTWYHSHFSLQYANGVFGGMIFHGPATSNYDEDLGHLFLSDWSHVDVFTRWFAARNGQPPALESGLINGTNKYDCSNSTTDPNCTGRGVKLTTVVEKGKKYRLRLVNAAIDGVFQFSIDKHKLKVIAADLVPIKPYSTSSLKLTEGQRYDVIFHANQAVDNYWIRAGWLNSCQPNEHPDSITSVLRYNVSSTLDPTTTSDVTLSTDCLDEPLSSLVPHLKIDVTNIQKSFDTYLNISKTNYVHWTINTSSLIIDWANPTLKQVFNGESLFPTDYNVLAVNKNTNDSEWIVLVIQDQSNLGLEHPIHLHGHDFWILDQSTGTFDASTSPNNFKTKNPPRRDVAALPGNGYLAIAFMPDNPGAWLCHCHIAWHASEGLSLEFLEREADIQADVSNSDLTQFNDICGNWSNSLGSQSFQQEDSGI